MLLVWMLHSCHHHGATIVNYEAPELLDGLSQLSHAVSESVTVKPCLAFRIHLLLPEHVIYLASWLRMLRPVVSVVRAV